MFLEIAEMVSAIGSTLIISSTIPQFYQTVKTRLTRDLSIRFLILILVSSVVWTVYAIVNDDKIYLIGESIDMALWLVVFLIALHNRNSKNPENKTHDCKCHGECQYMKVNRNCPICDKSVADLRIHLKDHTIDELLDYQEKEMKEALEEIRRRERV